MTFAEAWEVLQSEGDNQLIADAANELTQYEPLMNGITNSLGLALVLIREQDIYHLKLMFAVVYKAGILVGQSDALELLTREAGS